MSNSNENDNKLTLPARLPVNYDILPEGLNIIATGLITSERQYYDLLEGHKRDGYTHHVRFPAMNRWWEVAMVARVVEGESALTLQKGCVLLFYCGTQESFTEWQRVFAERMEKLAMGKASGTVQ